jgi:hypothetical protein
MLKCRLTIDNRCTLTRVARDTMRVKVFKATVPTSAKEMVEVELYTDVVDFVVGQAESIRVSRRSR